MIEFKNEESRIAVVAALKAVDRGMDFAIQSIKDVQVIIRVFLNEFDKRAQEASREDK